MRSDGGSAPGLESDSLKRDSEVTVTRPPDDDERQPPVDDATSAGAAEAEPPIRGGRAAERLREHLRERFGDDAPPVPPDEGESLDKENSENTEEEENP